MNIFVESSEANNESDYEITDTLINMSNYSLNMSITFFTLVAKYFSTTFVDFTN